MKHIITVVIILILVTACPGKEYQEKTTQIMAEEDERIIYDEGETLSKRINTP